MQNAATALSCAVCETTFEPGRGRGGAKLYCTSRCRRLAAKGFREGDDVDLYARGWERGRTDALIDLQSHAPHENRGDCDLCQVIAAVVRGLQAACTRSEDISAPPAQAADWWKESPDLSKAVT